LPVEAQRKSLQSPELDVTQSSSVDQSLVIVSAPLVSSEDHTPPDEGTSTAVCESVEHSVLLPSSVEPADHPRRTKEEKGKDKVGDDRPIVPLVERSEASLSSNLMANRAEDETRESFPREETEGEQPEPIAVSRPVEMPEVLRAKFLTSMFKMKKFTQKGQPTILPSSDAELTEKAIMAEEQRNLLTTSSLVYPLSTFLSDTGSLSDSDKETERYLERMLLNAAAESPFAQVSSVAEVAEKILGFEHAGAREAETATTKEVSALTAGKGEIQTMSIADYESRLRREGSIASQIATDASPVGGSTSGQTPDAIYWFISDTLNQLGEKWLGNPLITLAGLIPAPAMAKLRQ
jgi:hypothetical protein